MEDVSAYLFWDVDSAKIKIDTHQFWLVQRVLEKGTWEDWKKLHQIYTDEQQPAPVMISDVSWKEVKLLITETVSSF